MARGWRLGVAVLATLSPAAFATAGRAAAAEGEPAFCGRRTLRDYLTPLRGLPKLRELPYRRVAEPGFRHVEIGASGPQLAVGGGSAGYQFNWGKNPDWYVTVVLARVNASGAVVRRLGERRLGTEALRPALITEPRFGLPSKPGIYRTILTIRSASGRKLATFGNYYLVVKPRIEASFATDAAT